MGRDPHPGEIVLHTALLSELSTAESWANGNSVLYPILESFSTDDEHDYEYEFSSFSQLYS